MNVVVPYAEGAPFLDAVRLSLHAQGIRARYVAMRDDLAYWRLLRSLWARRRSFLIVEHDVVPWPGALGQLWDCPRAWCAFPYRLSHDASATALGCTKFGAELMRAVPDALDRLGLGIDFSTLEDPRHWSGLDGRLSLVFSATRGWGWPHRHEPPVTHLNPIRFGKGPEVSGGRS